MPIPVNFPYERSKRVESFDTYRSVTVAVGTNPTILCTFQAPSNMGKGYITLFGHGIDDVTGWPLSTWQIRRNGAGVKDYAQIQDQLAEFTDPKEIGPIPFYASDVIDVVVINGSAGAHLYAARLRGFVDYGVSAL
jgi:hypothetical protein